MMPSRISLNSQDKSAYKDTTRLLRVHLRPPVLCLGGNWLRVDLAIPLLSGKVIERDVQGCQVYCH